MDSRKITDPLNRGMVGGLLGMPADMLNMLRNGGRSVGNLANRLAGVNAPPAPMVENPVYGQEWWGNKMQQAGYVSPNRNKLAEFGAGLLDPGSVMTDVPMLAKGLFALGDPALQAVTKVLLAKRAYDVAPDVARTAAKNLSAPATLNKPGFAGQRGAVVWHGSPHAFDAFDSSKIGAGEGQQAFGHGMYFAEQQGVAKEYAETLKPRRAYKLGDMDISFPRSGLNKAKINYPSIKDVLYLSGGDVEKATNSAKISKELSPENSLKWDFVLSELSKIKQDDVKQITPESYMYKVDLPDEDIARMLDWDKPLSEQPQNVQKAFAKIGAGESMTGQQAYRAAHEAAIRSGTDLPAAEKERYTVEALRKAGIPGIRYLDGGSRGTGQGSSNFVVFPGNENRLKILERNGKPLK